MDGGHGDKRSDDKHCDDKPYKIVLVFIQGGTPSGAWGQDPIGVNRRYG